MTAFVEAVDARGLDVHAVAVHRGGDEASFFWHPYRPNVRHVLYSLTKTFTALGALFAVQEGKLTLDDPVLGFFPRLVPTRPSPEWQAVTVRHLLTMTLGMDADPINTVVVQRDWVKAVLAVPLNHPPGTRFVYNNMASYLAGSVVQAAVGSTLKDWLTPRLFDPLGIDQPPWDPCPKGRTIGGWGLYLSLDEVVRLGRLLASRGQWEGRQLLASALVDDAVRHHIDTGSNPDNEGHQGYGYQIWRCREGAFRADGAFGQLCYVRPDLDLVVAIQAGVPDVQVVLDLIRTHLVPGGVPRLPADPRFRLPPTADPAGGSDRWHLWVGRAWDLVEHPSGWKQVGLDQPNGVPELWYRDDRGVHRAPFGWGRWVESRNGLWRHDSQRRRQFTNLASASWEGDRFVLTLRFPEQAPVVTLTLAPHGAEIALSQHLSVTLQPTNFENIRGVPCTL